MRKRKKYKKIKVDPNIEFDYKNPDVLKKFITLQGAIIPRSKTGLSQTQQRRLAKAIKRARHLALLPFIQKI